MTLRALLLDCYAAGLRTVAPDLAVRRVAGGLDLSERVWIVAIGKAASPMARSAVESCAPGTLAGGLIVAPALRSPPAASIEVVVGEHPEPGHGSATAAERLADLVHRVNPGDTVWVLLSGGATSLLAGPATGLSIGELTDLFGALQRSGLPIVEMNRVRSRLTRWGGGALARAVADRGARVVQCVLSDVVGNTLHAIGSGPCAPPDRAHPNAATLLRAIASEWGLDAGLVGRALAVIGRPPNAFPHEHVETIFVGDNGCALAGVARRAQSLGLPALVRPEPLMGEASADGASFADDLLRRYSGGEGPLLIIQGGETTVRFRRGHSDAKGGRCQEFVLAAAERLAHAPADAPLGVLAMGTDGRDGPTDAAGGWVTPSTAARVAASGFELRTSLANHASYEALAAAGALVHTGLTGTNVLDVVLGWVGVRA